MNVSHNVPHYFFQAPVIYRYVSPISSVPNLVSQVSPQKENPSGKRLEDKKVTDETMISKSQVCKIIKETFPILIEVGKNSALKGEEVTQEQLEMVIEHFSRAI